LFTTLQLTFKNIIQRQKNGQGKSADLKGNSGKTSCGKYNQTQFFLTHTGSKDCLPVDASESIQYWRDRRVRETCWSWEARFHWSQGERRPFLLLKHVWN